jgi:hypothetical protein
MTGLEQLPTDKNQSQALSKSWAVHREIGTFGQDLIDRRQKTFTVKK